MRLLNRRVATPVDQMVVLWILCGSAAIAAEAANHDQQHASTDQILVVCTRGYPCGIGHTLDFDTFRAREIGLDGVPTVNRLPLEADDSFTHTWIFVHGNQISAREATRRGVLAYRKLRRQSTTSGSLRFVIWSWPSMRNTGRLRDGRQKMKRTDGEAFLLGSYLAKVSGDPISLVGHSFGARIITGAVHLAAGGSVSGSRLKELPDSSTRYRVALLAAAVERNALCPGGRYKHALDRTHSLLLVNNSRDQALSFFWAIDPGRKRQALGTVGLTCIPQAAQIEQCNWTCVLGREHSFLKYMNSPAIVSRISLHMSM